MIDLRISLKKNENMIVVSGIVPRLDELNNKATEVNNRLELMCQQRGLPYISHCETNDPRFDSYGIRFLHKIFQIFCSSLIDIN